LPGSYATTEADAKNVKTGKEAVARYALPNPDPASYVYTIKPKPTPIWYISRMRTARKPTAPT